MRVLLADPDDPIAALPEMVRFAADGVPPPPQPLSAVTSARPHAAYTNACLVMVIPLERFAGVSSD
ncbi:hypothetical protein [Paraburkholderia unamae]|uniref:hypothetical protein n=1 Tax=Paraburkholderia unamae TaxID=219649 RepID=UPI00319E09C5